MYNEYLLNMGVTASLTMPILRDGELWGLIACHHYSATPLPFPVRAASELLAQVVSLQLRTPEEREQLKYCGQMDFVHHTLLTGAVHEGGLAEMSETSPSLMDGIRCGGVAI